MNKQVVRRVYEECLNSGHTEVLNDLVADDFVGPGGNRGPQAFVTTVKGLRESFSGIHYDLQDVVAEGDRVVVRWRLTGTHTGTFRTFAPTNKAFDNEGIAIYRLRGGKIVNAWVLTDQLGFLQQIGVIAPPKT